MGGRVLIENVIEANVYGLCLSCSYLFFFFSSRRRHTRFDCDWSSDVCSSDLLRDPMSPPFHVNFVRGLRVLQISAALPQGAKGVARLVPIDFQHAPLPPKPRKIGRASCRERV